MSHNLLACRLSHLLLSLNTLAWLHLSPLGIVGVAHKRDFGL